MSPSADKIVKTGEISCQMADTGEALPALPAPTPCERRREAIAAKSAQIRHGFDRTAILSSIRRTTNFLYHEMTSAHLATRSGVQKILFLILIAFWIQFDALLSRISKTSLYAGWLAATKRIDIEASLVVFESDSVQLITLRLRP